MGVEKVIGIMIVVITAITAMAYYNFGRVESIDSTLKSHISESDSDRKEIKKRLYDHLIKQD